MDSVKPPLDAIVYEQLAQAWHRTDLKFWPEIKASRVNNNHPLGVPVPPQTPLELLHKLMAYASVLFQIEANHYKAHNRDDRYEEWLYLLTRRVVNHVLNAYTTLDAHDLDATLSYHGLSPDRINAETSKFLKGLADQQMRLSGRSIEVQLTLAEQIEALNINAAHARAAFLSEQTQEASPLTHSTGAVPFSERLAELKVESRLTQQQIADGIHIELRTVQRHLAGTSRPRGSQVEAYQDFFSKHLKRHIRFGMS